MNRSPVSEAGELKPCPFCGAPAEMEPWHGGGPDKQLIQCSSEQCDACPAVTGETRFEAIAAWNRRSLDNADGVDEAALDLTKRIEREFYHDWPGGALETHVKVRAIIAEALSRPIQNGEVGVKALVWSEFSSDDKVLFMQARGLGVRYEVFHKASDVEKIGIQVARYLRREPTEDDEYPDDSEVVDIIGYGRDLAGAYAIAQADFDQRIRSALTPPAVTAGEAEQVAWRDVVGFESRYEVSSHGDIRSKATGRVLSKSLMGLGYEKAEFWHEGKRTQTSVHRVVAEAFVPNVDGKPEVNHKDGVKTNNRADNLEWVTRSENEVHSRYGLGNLVKPVISIDPETGATATYPSIAEAGRQPGFNATGIYFALKGDTPTHGGKQWRYAPPLPQVDEGGSK